MCDVTPGGNVLLDAFIHRRYKLSKGVIAFINKYCPLLQGLYDF